MTLDRQIGDARADHLRRALEAAFPLDRNPSSGRTARAEALLALRELADEHGRRRGGLAPDALVKALGPGGDAILKKLEHPSVRLLMKEKRTDGLVYTLSHDRMAELVRKFVEEETARGNLEVDERVLELRRFVAQRTELYLRSKDPGALVLTRQRYRLIAQAAPALLWGKERQAWWEACLAHRKRQRKPDWRRCRYGRRSASG